MVVLAAAPSRLNDGHEIDDRSAPQWIMNQMGVRTEAQAHLRSSPSRIDEARVDGRAKRDPSSKRWFVGLAGAHTVADAGTQTVRADQQISAVQNCRRASLKSNGHAIAVRR